MFLNCITDIKVKELDQKIEIFSYMMRLNLPVVGVMPGFYYENILDIFKPRKVDVGVYGFGTASILFTESKTTYWISFNK